MIRLRSLRARLAIFSGLAVLGSAFAYFVAGGVAFHVHERQELEASGGLIHDREAEENKAFLLKMAAAMVIAGPFAAAFAAAIGLWMARRALAPLQEAGQRARAARKGSGQLLLPVRGLDDEWDGLASEVNGLLLEQRRASERARAFSANAAHELRTPLTALLGEVQLGLRRDRTPAEYRQVLVRAEAEVTRLATLVELLLTLSRADASEVRARGIAFDLAEVATEAAESARAGLGAEVAAVRVQATSAMARGDPLLTKRILENLVDNALRHGARVVNVRVEPAGSTATVTISDDGPGLPPPVRERLFERFNRLAGAADGFGLGLSIAHAIAVAQGGRLWLLNDGSPHTTFVLELAAAVMDDTSGLAGPQVPPDVTRDLIVPGTGP